MGSLAALPLARGLAPSLAGSADTPFPDLVSFKGREDEEFWLAVRKCFALDPEVVYLNNGSLGPTPLPVLRDLAEFASEIASNPTEKMWGPLGGRIEEVREKAAALLGVTPDDVALTRNTTEGIGTVGLGLGLRAGDEVITTDQEHPGGAGVWQFLETRGVRRVTVSVPLPPAPWESLSAFAARMPVTATPWELSAKGSLSLLTKSHPGRVLPSNSGWSKMIPVSSTATVSLSEPRVMSQAAGAWIFPRCHWRLKRGSLGK